MRARLRLALKHFVNSAVRCDLKYVRKNTAEFYLSLQRQRGASKKKEERSKKHEKNQNHSIDTPFPYVSPRRCESKRTKNVVSTFPFTFHTSYSTVRPPLNKPYPLYPRSLSYRSIVIFSSFVPERNSVKENVELRCFFSLQHRKECELNCDLSAGNTIDIWTGMNVHELDRLESKNNLKIILPRIFIINYVICDV